MRRFMRFAAGVLAALTLLLTDAAPAGAGPAISFDETTQTPITNPPFTLGWQFSTSAAVTVTALGVFDSDLNGLAEAYPVGIWDAGGTLLVTATVSSGTADPLTNQFRYVAVAPVVLNPGVYQIGALFGSDGVIIPGDPVTNFATDPLITFIQPVFAFGGSLANPLNPVPGLGYFGPNFLLAEQVPEPATLAVLSVGLLGFGLMRRWKRL